MGISEAIKVLNLAEDRTLEIEHVNERFEAMNEMNINCKRKSPYLIAKINNAKNTLINNIEGKDRTDSMFHIL